MINGFKKGKKMNYNGHEEEVEINGTKYTAYFPKKHTTVKGIVYIYKRWDANAGDSWANISRWEEHITLYVLWKGHVEWERIVLGDENTSSYNLAHYNYGHQRQCTTDVLFQMETKEKQRKVNLREKKEELKNEIKEKERELKKVTKELEATK